MPTYNTILTNAGLAEIAAAIISGSPINITTMVVGDGGGSPTTPAPTQTALVNQVDSVSVDSITVDPVNSNWLHVRGTIPSSVGGWWVREVGLEDSSGNLVAVGNFPDTYKPAISMGSSRDLIIDIIIQVSDTSAVTLEIDPSIALASTAWVEANYLAIANLFSEIKALGSADQCGALSNLGVSKDDTKIHTGYGMTVYDNGANVQVILGQGGSNGLSLEWIYNATAGSAVAEIGTLGNNNDLYLLGKDIYMSMPSLALAFQLFGSGRLRIGGGSDDGSSAFQVNGDLGIAPTTAATATAGSATLPANPVKFWVIKTPGGSFKIPLYNT